MKKKKRPRFIQWIYAFIHGYFWLPCPICGESFGGHEWAHDIYTGGGAIHPNMPSGGTGVCPDCVEKAKKTKYRKIWLCLDRRRWLNWRLFWNMKIRAPLLSIYW